MTSMVGGSVTSARDTSTGRRVMIVSGEASGDIYGADLVEKTVLLAPDLHFFGIGGVRMREQGVETLVDSADMAVMGLVEVVKHFNVISRAFLTLKKILRENPPELLILIDYPGFNIRLAKVAKKAGVKVLYYISPKVWAWKAGRIKTIAERVNQMAVIFPFEVPLYQKAGVPVCFVGHPMLDLIRVALTRDEAAASFGLDPSRKVVGLFPGSRRSEIERILPAIVEAAVLLKERFPDLQFVLPLASTLQENEILPYFASSNIPLTITRERIHELIRGCDTIISVSGTVTLEIALVGTPMVIIYKLAPLTYSLAKRVVKIEHIGLCNIVAGKTLVKEMIQDEASPENMAEEMGAILSDSTYENEIRCRLAGVRSLLGGGGAAENVARLAVTMMEQV